MKLIIARISFVLSALFVVGAVFFINNPVAVGGPCSCPPDSYRFGSVVFALLRNAFQPRIPADCSQFGCTLAYFVMPVDLIVLAIILIAVGIALRRNAAAR